ncbi:tetratricopeptide repeat protein [Aliikangiella maris]|uniref:Tetratricopeptide repeat protein n=2 Tax=Aliikangiella maris TaxID=3162458 RepID=A0ABV2BTT0_9GAMM
MTELWIAIILVLIFSVVFVCYSTFSDNQQASNVKAYNHNKLMLILPLLFLIITPVAYFQLGSYKKQADWNRVKNSAETLLNNGDLSNVEMNMQDLILALRTQAFENPQNGQLWFELGQAYANLQMRDLAMASLQRAVRVDNNPDWVVATAQIMSAGDSSDDLKQAANMLMQVLEQTPDHQSALLTLGFVYYKLAQFEAAIEVWTNLAAQPGMSERSRNFIQQQISEAQQALESQ